MASVAELILSIVGKDDTAGALKSASGNLKGLEKGALAAGATITGLGVGIEAMARANEDSNVQVRQSAAALGITEGEYRKLATSLSNATFPLEDVNDLLELAREEGLRSKEDLADYAAFWDTIGDATGSTGPALASAATGLRAVGIAAGDEGKAMDAFGFITENTKLDVEDFLGILEKKGAELGDFGIDINDTAAILGVMERELGLTGRAAATEFATALDASDGSMESLLDTLGISQKSFDETRSQVDGSSSAIKRNAAIVADAKTPMQNLESAWKDFMFTHAGVIDGLAQFAPIMIAAGPAMGLLSGGIRGIGLAATFAKGPLVSMGMALLTPPLGIVIAIAAALVLIWIFRDDIIAAFKEIWEKVEPLVTAFKDGVVGAFNAVVGWAKEHWPEIATILSGPFAPIVLLATDAFGVRSALTGAFNAVLDFGKDHWPEIATLISGPFAPIVLLATDAFGVRSKLLGALTEMKDKVSGWIGDIVQFFKDLPGKILGALGSLGDLLWDKGRDLIQGFIDGMKSLPIPNPLDLVPGGGLVKKGAGALGGLIPGRAVGGSVTSGDPFLVGERGPELFVPSSSGRIVPNGQYGGGLNLTMTGPVTVVNNGQQRDARGTLADVAFAMAAELRSRGRMLTA